MTTYSSILQVNPLRFTVLFILGILVFPLKVYSQNVEKKRPNILFIFPDQLRSDYIGGEDSNIVHTPNLDQIAREGALFSRAYSATPTCLPARAALMTGMAPWKNGLLSYAPMATKYKYQMPQMLRDAGYYTFATGKLHYKPIGSVALKVEPGELDNSKFMHGFHEIKLCEGWGHPQNDYNIWFKEKAPDLKIDGTGLGPTDHRTGIYPYNDELHPTAWTANQAIDFINDHASKDPFFLKVAFHRPHPPFDPPKRWLDFYKNREIPLADVGKWSEDKFGKFNSIPSPEQQLNAPRGNYSDSIVENARKGYYAAISFLDEQIGYILTALEKKGELENTLIVVSSDHGDMMGDHHLWRKSYPYEGSAAVPMIIRWPESIELTADRGQVIKELVELRDVLPTFLDVAGVAVPSEMDGMSMIPLIEGNNKGWRKVLDLEHGQCYWKENSWTGLTDERYKYIYYAVTGEEQLFDLLKDPKEKKNLANLSEYNKSLKRWRQKMIDHLRDRGHKWVKDGKLVRRGENIMFSPNYPKDYFPKEILNQSIIK
ncbi:arylsulfatase [Arenibacter aquaticus]|uniref:Arylsulfatase n=1 Tax=Arenibacter aquaticus TaxID=2489054 RepID=A0A430K460_9FLAO|nr:arylsulfatase [Arenibacter aquaticus]RTE53778.1 arylsulfatase [Arenibacter aquaticus]